ncbi:MAG: hypothetical protein KDA63_17805, partial [Planctomycetales bacterium]|nr:hypothetical protein [Planctomycetales bacterium]
MEATAFELLDPAERLPKWIGWGPGLTPWETVCGDVREGRLADWLSTCEPVVSHTITFTGCRQAHDYVGWRLRQIEAWCGEWPGWIL